MPGEWPLIGRVEELSVISGLIRRRDGPAGVVLAGAAGVGKTRLAREALAQAQRRDVLIRWAVATASARALPLGAFAATVGVVGPDPARLVEQARAALVAGAGRAGVIVGVDDAHLLDELSAMVVHQLVLRRAAVVVLTLRTGETAPDAVTALWKDEQLTRLELQPLSETETAALVGARLGGQLDTSTARRLWTLTQGNALYLRHLVDGKLEAGRLHQVTGVWQGSGELALSPGLAELISARIGQLSEAQKDVVEVLAFGEPLGVSVLAGLTRTDAQRVQAAISRATNLFLTLGCPDAAESVLDAAASTVSTEITALELAAMRSILDASLGRSVRAADAAAGVLAHPACSPAAMHLADWGLATASGALGRLGGMDESLRRIEASVESFEIGLHQAVVVVVWWLRALLLGGLLDRAERTARRYRERWQDTPGTVDALTSLMCGSVAAFAGQAQTAARWYRQAIAAIHAGDPGGISFRLFTHLTTALGMAGDAIAARQALAEMTAAQHPGFALAEPDVLLAHAWVAAATRAHRLARACEGARTPALIVLATPLPLTAREREIVTLAAGGLSNRQIAQRLVVSVRTVENHLYRACAKLGAADRAELAALLRNH